MMTILKKFVHLINILSILLLVSCHHDKKNDVKKKPISFTLLSKVINKEIKPIRNTSVHTSQIGTIDYPTIDGGIINGAAGYINETSNADSNMPTSAVNKEAMEKPLSPDPFEDKWVTSSKIKKVLNKAAQEGKLRFIMEELEKKELPASIALIPIVESDYRKNSISPKGAVGVWQIMPSLAHDYNLSEKDRFDFIKSTQVALLHLKNLYKQFGNWELAFAAYNAGSKRIERALLKNPHANTIQDLNLPNETKQYVAKVKSINHTLSRLEL